MPYYRAVAQAAAAVPERIGVLLVNFGSPAAPTYRAVLRSLRHSLSDIRTADTARWIRLPLLYGFILPLRAIRVVREYRSIWMPEGPPLAVYTGRLAQKIESRLQAARGDGVRVGLAAIHGSPTVERAIELLAQQNVKHLVVLPLHPQYCGQATGAVFDRTAAALERWRWLPETRFVSEYFAAPGYAEAIAARIERHREGFAEHPHLVLCYRGVSARQIARGDPFRGQAEATSARIASIMKLAEGTWSHCYLSSPGPSTPLGPSLEETLRGLAARGERRLTVSAPSHAVDCLETLHGIAVEAARRFRELGGESLTLVPALNDDDRHADFLASVVRSQFGGWT